MPFIIFYSKTIIIALAFCKRNFSSDKLYKNIRNVIALKYFRCRKFVKTLEGILTTIKHFKNKSFEEICFQYKY